MIMRIVLFVLIIIGYVFYKWIKCKYIGINIPLMELDKRLLIFYKHSVNKASMVIDIGRNTPYVELVKIMGRGIPTRLQMILRRESFMREVFDKSQDALERIGVPFLFKEYHSGGKNIKINTKLKTTNEINDYMDSEKRELLIVECGRNYDLLKACAYAVLIEGFGIPIGSYIRIKVRGPHYFKAKVSDSYFESLNFSIKSKGTIEGLSLIINELVHCNDEKAYIIFGAHSRPLPVLRKRKNNKEIIFTLDVPSVDRTSQKAVRLLRENGEELNKIEQTEYGPIFRINLGTSQKLVVDKLVTILSDWFEYDTKERLPFRLVKVITTDWYPPDGYNNHLNESHT